MLTEPDDIPIYYENDNGFHSGRTNIHEDWTQLKLMQYTGLKDRNGEEIYEGDVLSGHEDGNVEVKWFGCGWSCDFEDGNGIGLDEAVLWFGNNMNVVGNIYENPELIRHDQCKRDRGEGCLHNTRQKKTGRRFFLVFRGKEHLKQKRMLISIFRATRFNVCYVESGTSGFLRDTLAYTT